MHDVQGWIRGSGPYLLLLDRLPHPAKGVDVLVLAMAELVRSHPRVHLVLVGDGPRRADDRS